MTSADGHALAACVRVLAEELTTLAGQLVAYESSRSGASSAACSGLVGALSQLGTIGMLLADRVEADWPGQDSLRPLVAEWWSQAALAADLAEAAALGGL